MEPLPRLGYGLGLRPVYYDEIPSTRPPVDWFEVISENYMVPGGRPVAMLERFRSDYPIVMHGVSMSLASVDPRDMRVAAHPSLLYVPDIGRWGAGLSVTALYF